MQDNKEERNIEEIPLVGKVDYPHDPELTEYFGVTHGGTIPPKWDNVAKHLKVSDNMYLLQKAIREGAEIPKELPTEQPSEKTAEDSDDNTGEVDIKSIGEKEEEEEDLKTFSTKEKEEEEYTDDDATPGKELSEVERAELANNTKNPLEAEIVRENPEVTRKFKEHINDVSVRYDPPHMANNTLLGSSLGIFPKEEKRKGYTTNGDGDDVEVSNGLVTVDTEPANQLIHEFVGLSGDDLTVENEKGATTKLVEGMNRAYNIFVMAKANARGGIEESAQDVFNEFAADLGSTQDLKRILDYYRKAGNVRHVDEDKKPEAKKPTRNNRYLWLGVPHGDGRHDLGDDEATVEKRKQSADDMKRLRMDLDAFIAGNALGKESGDESGADTEKKTILVEVLTAATASNANAVRDAMAGVILRIGNQSIHENLTTYATAEDPVESETGPTEKEAGDGSNSGQYSAAATGFAKNFSTHDIISGNLLNKKNFENMILKWFGYLLFEKNILPPGASKPSAAKFDDVFGANGEVPNETKTDRRETQLENRDAMKSWYTSGKSTGSWDSWDSIANKFPEFGWFFAKHNPLYEIAAKVSDEVYDYNLSLLENKGALDLFAKSFIKHIGSFLSLITTQVVSSDEIKEVLGNPTSRAEASAKDIRVALRNRIKSLVSSPVVTGGDKRVWENIKDDYEKNEGHSLLSMFFEKWGEYLSSEEVAKADVGYKFEEDPEGWASDMLQKRVVNPLENGCTDKQITAYFTSALEDATGSMHTAIKEIRSTGSHVIKNTFANVNSDRPYLNTVYITSAGVSSAYRKGMTVHAGESYELAWGDYSESDRDRTQKLESKSKSESNDEATDVKFKGYIFQVVDGRAVIEEHESRLSVNEIPKFIEFAANNFVSRMYSNQEKNMSSMGIDTIKSLNKFIDKSNSDLSKMEMGAGHDPIMENQYARFFRGKTSKEIQDILERLDKNREGTLAQTMNRVFGSKVIDKGDDVYTNEKSKAQKVLETHNHSDYKDHTDRIINDVVKGLTNHKLTLDELGAKSIEGNEDRLKAIMNSKEFHEEFVKTCLNSDISLPYSANGSNHRLHGLMQASHFDKALRTILERHGHADLLRKLGTHSLSKQLTDPRVKEFNSLIMSFDNSNTGAADRKIWENAENSDKKTFDSLFKASNDFKFKSTLKAKEVDELLTLLANDQDNSLAMDKELLDIMQPTETGYVPLVGGLDENGEPIKSRKKGNTVNLEYKKSILRDIAGHYPEEDIKKVLGKFHGALEKFVNKPKVGRERTKASSFSLRESANFHKLFEFLKSNPELAEKIDPRGDKLAEIDKGHSEYLSGDKKIKGLKKNEGTFTGMPMSKIKGYMNEALDGMKDHLEADPHSEKLVSSGSSINKMMAGVRGYESKTNKLSDLTKVLTELLEHSDNVLEKKIKKQAEETSGLENKKDYTDPSVRTEVKAKVLIKWFKRLGMYNQKITLSNLKKFIKAHEQFAKEGKDVIDPYLGKKENFDALKELNKLSPTRG